MASRDNRAYQALWYQENKEHVKKRVRDRAKALRDELMSKLGNRCTCCSESQPRFLALDHINGVSDEERALAIRYRRGGAKKLTSGRRPRLSGDLLWVFAMARLDEFQILCHNCNMGRHLNGGTCPHKDPK